MNQVNYSETWPSSWKSSYAYDRQEVYGEILDPGYFFGYQVRAAQTVQLVNDHLPPGSRVLDVAAAQGNFTLKLAELGYEVTWNDIRGELQPYVELKREHGVVSYRPGNVFEITFDSLFDAVVITEVIEHVAHPDKFLSRIAELVVPGGYIILTTPNGRYFRNSLPRFSDFSNPEIFEASQFGPNADDHIFLLHPDEVYSLAAQCGLSVDQFKLTTSMLTCGHVKSHYLLKQLPQSLIFRLENFAQSLPTSIKQKICTNITALLRKQFDTTV